MKKLSRHPVAAPVLILVVCAAAAVLLILNRPVPEPTVAVQKSLLVDVAQVVKQDIAVSVRSQGTVTPVTETSLVSEVAGQIINVSPKFEAGAFFEKDEVLLQIDERNYRAALKAAEANVASARSNLAMEKGQAEVAYQDWLKFARNAGRSAEAEALALRKPQLADAQARLDSALAELARARDDLDRTSVRAPYAGMIRDTSVGLGQYVNTGSTLGTAFAVGAVEVRLPVPADRLNYLDLPGRHNDGTSLPAVTLTADFGPERLSWTGSIVRTEGVFDERSRVLFVVARVADPYGLHSNRNAPLRVGTFVEAEIQGRVMKNIVVLPRSVLRTGNQVWLIDGNDQLVNREVKLLHADGDLAYVYQGLENGERVSLSAIPHAVAGTGIRTNKLIKTTSLAAPTVPDQAATHLAGDNGSGVPRG